MDMKIYLREKKVKWIRQSYVDFLKDFGVELPYGTGFTRSDFFHFIIYDGKKYVHKKALSFVLTNGDTYFIGEENPKFFTVNTNQKTIDMIKDNLIKTDKFFREEINEYKIYPTFLGESEHFYIFEYLNSEDWTQLEKLNKEDSQYIKKHFEVAIRNKKEMVTPFYNQMFKKIFKNNKNNEIKAVDLKSLEFRPIGPLGILMYNGFVNDFYLLERRFMTKKYILKPLSLDYPVKGTKLIKHY